MSLSSLAAWWAFDGDYAADFSGQLFFNSFTTRVARSIPNGLGFVNNCDSGLDSYLLATSTQPKVGLEILTPSRQAIMLKNQKQSTMFQAIFLLGPVFLVIWLTLFFFSLLCKGHWL